MGINLDKLTKDLLLIIRGSKIAQSEVISERQIEDWIHQYRALLMRRDLGKGYQINQDYIQEMDNMELDFIEKSEDAPVGSGTYILRTKNKLPKTLDLPQKSGVTYVGTTLGKQLQVVPYNRLEHQKYRKYTSKDNIAALRNQYVYVLNAEELKYINVRGIFENPLEIEDTNETDWRTNYPLPQDKVPILKQMILQQELNIESQSPSDNTNDSSHRLSPNAETQRVQQQ